MSKISRNVVLWVLAGAFGACSLRTPEPLLTNPEDASATLTVVREREDAVTSLRSVFSAITAYEGRRRKTNGILLVRKPDRLRLRLWLLYGVTVFDYVRRGDEVEVNVPFDTPHPTPENAALFSRQNLAAAFLRGSDAFPGECVAVVAEDRDHVVTCREPSSGAIERIIRINPFDGTIKEEVSYGEGGEVRMILRFEDYRTSGGVALPYYVEMVDPDHELTVEITVRRYEVNRKLADILFQ